MHFLLNYNSNRKVKNNLTLDKCFFLKNEIRVKGKLEDIFSRTSQF